MSFFMCVSLAWAPSPGDMLVKRRAGNARAPAGAPRIGGWTWTTLASADGPFKAGFATRSSPIREHSDRGTVPREAAATKREGRTQGRFVGQDRLEVTVTLPTLIMGTVGGGTGMPAFKMLSMIGCYGPGKARRLAEIMAAVVLAGEIGCGSAQCAFEFVRAHETMGKNPPGDG
jgi:hypothetical protein